MSDASYFRQLASRCQRLARSCFDLGTAGELREMASEFERKAAEAEQQNRAAETSETRATQRTRRPN